MQIPERPVGFFLQKRVHDGMHAFAFPYKGSFNEQYPKL
ncbi:hypothetical protein EMIT0P44_340043 [Pseudomonas sp. IT-P44]